VYKKPKCQRKFVVTTAYFNKDSRQDGSK